MSALYACDDDDRRRAVRAQATINGIDFLEVELGQTALNVTFIHPLPGEAGAIPDVPELEVSQLAIEGGTRISPITVLAVSRPLPNVLRVTVDQPGDFSPYTLRLRVGPDALNPPPGFDPTLCAIEFSFKATCPTDLPCAQPAPCLAEQAPDPVIDYLAKDYDSFRSVMLARLRQLMPGWQDNSPADPYIALVEALAFTADRYSYMQDAAGAEAYIGTARQRISVARHTRLIGYALASGNNARSFVHCNVSAAANGQTLLSGTPVLSKTPGLGADISMEQYQDALAKGALSFATMADVQLQAAHNRIAFYNWSRRDCCLKAGATRAALVNSPLLSLAVGDYLLMLQTLGATTGIAADADPDLAHVVRLTEVASDSDPLDGSAVLNIAWADADALPFDLPLSAAVGTDGAEIAVAEARGNITLADHGAWMSVALSPDTVPTEGQYRPCLLTPDITYARPLNTLTTTASAALRAGSTSAAPAIQLQDATGAWTFQSDLLSSDRFANDVVAELDDAGYCWLRFGDDSNGRAPTRINQFTAMARIGNGTRGNIGRNTLRHAVTVATGGAVTGILQVSNPLPGSGGKDAETLAHARLFAPASVHRQERAVTASDWSEWALRYPGVQRAAAELRWTGSWYTVFVTVDRFGGDSIDADAPFRQGLLQHLNRGRLAGYDLELRDPLYAPVRLKLRICLARNFASADVRAGLLDCFTSGLQRNGRKGFFHPDQFSFGDPLYASRIYAAAMAIDGVGSVEILTFQRWDRAANHEISDGVLTPDTREIVQLENDPSFPERGTLELLMEGAL